MLAMEYQKEPAVTLFYEAAAIRMCFLNVAFLFIKKAKDFIVFHLKFIEHRKLNTLLSIINSYFPYNQNNTHSG